MDFDVRENNQDELQAAAEQVTLSLKVQTEIGPPVPVRAVSSNANEGVREQRNRIVSREAVSSSDAIVKEARITAREGSSQSGATNGKILTAETMPLNHEPAENRERISQLDKPDESVRRSNNVEITATTRLIDAPHSQSGREIRIVKYLDESKAESHKVAKDAGSVEIGAKDFSRKIEDYQMNNKTTDSISYKEAFKEALSSRNDSAGLMRKIEVSSNSKLERPASEIANENSTWGRLDSNPVRMVVNSTDRPNIEQEVKPGRTDQSVGGVERYKVQPDWNPARAGKENGFDATSLRDGGMHIMPGPVGGGVKPGQEERPPGDGRRQPDGQFVHEQIKPVDPARGAANGLAEQLRPGDAGRGSGNTIGAEHGKVQPDLNPARPGKENGIDAASVRDGGMHIMPGPVGGAAGKPGQEERPLPGDARRSPDGQFVHEQIKPVDSSRGSANGTTEQLKPGDSGRGTGNAGGADHVKPGETGRTTGGVSDSSRQIDAARGQVNGGANEPQRILDQNKPIEMSKVPGGSIYNETSKPVELHRGSVSGGTAEPGRLVDPGRVANSTVPLAVAGGQHSVAVSRANAFQEKDCRVADHTGCNRESILQNRQELTAVDAIKSIAVGLPSPERRGEQPNGDKNGHIEEHSARPRCTVGPGSVVGAEVSADNKMVPIQPVAKGNFERVAGVSEQAVLPLPVRSLPEGLRLDARIPVGVESTGPRAGAESNSLRANPSVAGEGERRAGQSSQLVDSQGQGAARASATQKQTASEGAEANKVRPDSSGGAIAGRVSEGPGKGELSVAGRGDSAAKGDLTAAGRSNEAGNSIGQRMDLPLSAKPGPEAGGRDNRMPAGKSGESGPTNAGGLRVSGESLTASGKADGPQIKGNGQVNGLWDVGELSAVKGVRGELLPQVVAPSDRRVILPDGQRGEQKSEGVKPEHIPLPERLGAGGKRYITGVEIALAAVVAAGGIRKIRLSERAEQTSDPETDESERGQEVSSGGERWYSMEMVRRLTKGELQRHQSEQVLKRPVYLVSKHETLVSIAEELFGDPDLAWLIADVNGLSLKQCMVDGRRIVELQDRQQIDLPVWQDIIEFYEARPSGAIAANLVTIVSESQVNSELLSLMLRPVMGGIASNGLVGQIVSSQSKSEQKAAAQPVTPAGKVSLGQLEQQLSEIAGAVLSSLTDQWPKPPATLSSDVQP